MELNPECVRDVLKYLQERTGVYSPEHKKTMEYFEVRGKQLTSEPSLLEKYTPDEIFYTALQLYKGNKVEGEIVPGAKGEILSLSIIDLTWEGHEFLKNTESDTVWTQTLSICKKLGLASMEGVVTVAKEVFMRELKKGLSGLIG